MVHEKYDLEATTIGLAKPTMDIFHEIIDNAISGHQVYSV
jgi:hypothetical protein